jgi:hypothetical protein
MESTDHDKAQAKSKDKEATEDNVSPQTVYYSPVKIEKKEEEIMDKLHSEVVP